MTAIGFVVWKVPGFLCGAWCVGLNGSQQSKTRTGPRALFEHQDTIAVHPSSHASVRGSGKRAVQGAPYSVWAWHPETLVRTRVTRLSLRKEGREGVRGGGCDKGGRVAGVNVVGAAAVVVVEVAGVGLAARRRLTGRRHKRRRCFARCSSPK
jgi:hypothetical protein